MELELGQARVSMETAMNSGVVPGVQTKAQI